jgi:iron uptake system EfeUOB component EfeO/EfeM
VTPETDKLVFYLEDLQVKIRQMQLTPQGLLNGMARLAYEVGENKAAGGESRLSGTSLDDMRNNVAGIAAAYHVVFATALGASDAKLAQSVQGQIDKLAALLAVEDLRRVDADRLRAFTEELVVTLQRAAPPLGLRQVSLEELLQQ